MKSASKRISARKLALAVCLSLAGIVAICTSLRAEESEKKSGFFGRIVDLVKKKDPPPAAAEPAKAAEKTKPADTPATKDKPKATTAKSSSSKSTAKPTKQEEKVVKAPSKPVEVAKTKPAEDKAKQPAKPAAAEAKTFAASAKPAESSKSPSAETKTAKAPETASPSPAAEKTAAVAATTPTPTVTAQVPASATDLRRQFGNLDSRALDVTSSSKAVGTDSVSKQLSESSGSINAPLPPTSRNTSWEIIKYGGRDYVTADSIHRFYAFSTHKVQGADVWFRSTNLVLKARVGSMDMLINNIKFVLSYPVAESGGKVIFSRLDLCKLIDPVLRPSYITGDEPFNTVVLDAGHGGHDTGAKGVYGYEKEFALKMVQATKTALEKRGFKVVLTRSGDTFISRTGRVAIANNTPNSIFISLHFNSGGSSATGIETFALTPQGGSASLARGGGYNARGLTGNQQDSENIALATAVHALVIHRFKLIDRGIKRAQWTVLTGCNRPGILFEGGFVTNSTECRLIASNTYREALANTIGDAVLNYRKALNQKPGMVNDAR